MDHIYSTQLDFGLLGELPVEVFYIYQQARLSNDPYQVQERGGVFITAITTVIHGHEIDITGLVRENTDLYDDLAYECIGDYRG